MAKKIICDVCGKECSTSGRYNFSYICMFKTEKKDICFNCFREIRSIIREKNKSI